MSDRRPAARRSRGVHIVVGGGDVAALGVEFPRQIFPEALPLVLPVARHRQAPVPAIAIRCQSGDLQRNIAQHVSADQAVGGNHPIHGALEKIFAALSLGHLEAAFVGRRTGFLHH